MLRRSSGLVAGLLFTAALLAAPTAWPQEVIKIGIPVRLSGANSVVAPSVVLSAELAAEEINGKGGILGKKIVLEVADDGSGPARAQKAFDSLISMETSAARSARLPIVSRSKVPFIYTSLYEGLSCNRYLYCDAPVPEQMAGPIADHFMKQGAKSSFLVGSDYAFGRGMLAFIRRRGTGLRHQPKIRPGENPLRLLIVADVRLYREGMHASLSSRPQFSVVGAASDVDEALRLTVDTHPDVVIVDMAARQSLTVVRRIRHHAPNVHIVGFGVEEVEGEILACAEAGLAGYVPCDASLDDLVMRVESVHRGELLCTPRMSATLFRRLESRHRGDGPPPQGLILTAREREVLGLIDGGLSNKEIAVRLHIEVSTVKNHVHNLLEKLQVTSRMQAAARLGTHVSARQRGLGAHAHLHLD